MNTQLFLLFLFVALLILPSFIQKAKDKIYSGNRFSIGYPYNWEIAVQEEVVQLFPTDNNGSVTITSYVGIDLPPEEMPAYLLSLYQLHTTEAKVIIIPAGERTDYFFEHTRGGTQWFVKAVHNGNDLYLLTVNCEVGKWGSSKPLFLKVVNSFRLK